MNSDYQDLKALQMSRGWQKLLALWAIEGQTVMNGLQRSAARNQESAWRYYAGQIKGFEIAVGHLDRALMQMEKEGAVEEPETKSAEEIIAELRGEKK